MKLLVLLLLAAIVLSLGSGLFYLLRGKDDSGRMVKALTARISLSAGLFLLLILAYWQGWIQPNATPL